MIRFFLLSLLTLFALNSCITFNTGAKLDNMGKAVPALLCSYEGRYFKLNGVAYQERMVEYRQLNPKWVWVVRLPHNIDTFNSPTPPAESLGAPKAELYLVRLDIDRKDAPAFIRAADFDYASAERVDKKDLPVDYVHNSYCKEVDLETLTPSMYEGSMFVLEDLPTVRTTGNQIRRPLAIMLSYGVDLPLTVTSYAVGSVLYIILLPFGGAGVF